MASRRTDGHRATSRFVDSSENAFVTAQNLEDIDFRRIFTKVESFEKAKRYLDQDLGNYKNFRKHWEAAITTFGKKPVSDEDFMKVGIIAYTSEDQRRKANKETQLYSVLNEQSRKIGKSKESWKLFPYKGWYSILAHALYELPTSPDNIEEGAAIECYRGVEKKFKYKQGYSLVFNCFTSTSRDKKKAMQFKGGGGTLFQFDCIPYNSLGIEEYSMFGYEKEVLLAPWSAFRVGEMKNVKDKNGSYTLVKLIPEELEDEEEGDYEEYEEYLQYEDGELFDESEDEEDEDEEEDDEDDE